VVVVVVVVAVVVVGFGDREGRFDRIECNIQQNEGLFSPNNQQNEQLQKEYFFEFSYLKFAEKLVGRRKNLEKLEKIGKKLGEIPLFNQIFCNLQFYFPINFSTIDYWEKLKFHFPTHFSATHLKFGE